MKVKRNTLLLLACLVWSAAGFNILRIGLSAYPAYRAVVNYLLSTLVFAVFQIFIFGKLVKKHTARISAYEEERHFFLKFFDGKSFADHGGDDDRRHCAASQRAGTGAIHRLFLHRSRRFAFAGGAAVRL